MRKAVLIAGIMSVCFLLTGCKKFSPQITGISINDKNVITEVIKENFEGSSYNVDELAGQITGEVEAYNLNAGAKCIKSNKLKIRNNVAEITLTYATPKDFADFNHTDFYIGDMVGSIQAGYTFQGTFSSVAKGAVSEENIWGSRLMSEDTDYKTIVISEPMLVRIPGTIRYVSTGMRVTGNSEAVSETSDLAYILYE